MNGSIASRAQVRVDRQRVGVPGRAERGFGVGGGGAGDVAALGVQDGDEPHPLRRRQHRLHRLHAVRPEQLEERRLRLHHPAERPHQFEHAEAEPLERDGRASSARNARGRESHRGSMPTHSGPWRRTAADRRSEKVGMLLVPGCAPRPWAMGYNPFGVENILNAEGVVFQSPGSRSAPWVSFYRPVRLLAPLMNPTSSSTSTAHTTTAPTIRLVVGWFAPNSPMAPNAVSVSPNSRP